MGTNIIHPYPSFRAEGSIISIWTSAVSVPITRLGRETMFEMFSLQGSKAFISGASPGLSHEMAVTLAETGAVVALAVRTLKALERTAGTIRDNSSKDVTRITTFEEADFLGE
jgi:hypothetical protein